MRAFFGAVVSHILTRPRMFIALGVGIAIALLVPGISHAVTRVLLGWNVTVWLFLGMIGWMMLQADHSHLRRAAIEQAEGAKTVLAVVVMAAVVSIGAIVYELAAAKLPGAKYALPHLMFALATVAGSWLLLPTLFAMNYASIYHVTAHGAGLRWPDADPTYNPDYGDFLYFSFTIAVASQTADVSVCSRSMRRLVLVQSLLSFAFNTTILAFTINIAASLF
jgi:uncharacterized membrane protein